MLLLHLSSDCYWVRALDSIRLEHKEKKMDSMEDDHTLFSSSFFI